MDEIADIGLRCLALLRMATQHHEVRLLVWLAVTVACYATVAHLRLRSLAPLLAFPAIWIFVVVWGAVNWAPHIREPSLALTWPLHAAEPLFYALLLFFVWRLKEARLFTVAFASLNAHLIGMVPFIAGMAVSGSWL